MNAGKSMGDRFRIARLSAAHDNPSLGTLAGAAEVVGVEAPDTVGRWERGESTPTNFNVKQMAVVYHAPELLPNYCATSCPIGQGWITEMDIRPIAQLTLNFHNTSRSLKDDLQQLMRIAEDDVISEDERQQFDDIVLRLRDISGVIRTIEVMAEKHALHHGRG